MTADATTNVESPGESPGEDVSALDHSYRPGIFTGPAHCKCGKLLMVDGLYGQYQCPACHGTNKFFNFHVSFKVLFGIIVILWFVLILKQAELYLIALFGVAITVAFIILKDDLLNEGESTRELWQKWENEGHLVAKK